jgi:hypothetical protein
MRRTIAISAALLLALTALVACGDDDEQTATSISTEEFCEWLEELEDDSQESSDDIDLDLIDEVVANAPAELRDDLQVLRDKLAEIDALDIDEDDPEAFGIVMGIMFDPELMAAMDRIETYGVEECGMEPSDDDFGDFDFDVDSDEPGDDFGTSDDATDVAADGEPVAESPMPDDVTVTLQPAAIVTWEELDDAFNYRVELDGRTLDTTFGDRFVALGADADGEFAVEALEIGNESLGPAPGVEVTEGEALVVEWTEEDEGFYYVQYSSPTHGRSATMASSPFVIDLPADEVDSVAFGPAVVVRDDDGRRTDSPFEHGDEFYVELPLP